MLVVSLLTFFFFSTLFEIITISMHSFVLYFHCFTRGAAVSETARSRMVKPQTPLFSG